MADQVQKLQYINNRLGAGNAETQQTTRVVYDTVTVAGPGLQTLRFFDSFAGKTTPNFTNLTTNKLDSSDSMVVKWILLEFLQGTYTGSERQITQKCIFDITLRIGNDVKLKRFPLWLNSSVNSSQFLNRIQTDFSGGSTFVTGMYLTTNLVIPPQVDFSAEVRIANGTGATTQLVANDKLCLQLGGYGQIFSAGSSF